MPGGQVNLMGQKQNAHLLMTQQVGVAGVGVLGWLRGGG